jgi:hypothetical protein
LKCRFESVNGNLFVKSIVEGEVGQNCAAGGEFMTWERWCGQCGIEPMFCRCDDCECCAKPEDGSEYEELIVDAAGRLIYAIELFLEQETWTWPQRGCVIQPYPDPVPPHIWRAYRRQPETDSEE